MGRVKNTCQMDCSYVCQSQPMTKRQKQNLTVKSLNIKGSKRQILSTQEKEE